MSSALNQIIAEARTILAQCIVAANDAALAAASVSTLGYAPLNSPAFMGAPTAPTPPNGDISNRISTTAFLGGKLGQPGGIATLDASGIIPVSQLPFTGLTNDGSWNADTNTPTLASSTGTAGHFFVVGVAGSTDLNGITTWNVGDWALFSGTEWNRIPVPTPVLSNIPLSDLEGLAPGTVVANLAGGSASPTAVTVSQLTAALSVMQGDDGAGGVAGLVPAPPAGATGSGAFLAADGIWRVPTTPNLSAYALLDSPSFINNPIAPTKARGTNSTAIATMAAIILSLATVSEMVPKVDGTAACGTSTYGTRIDHVHPTDTSRAAGTATVTGAGLVAISGNLGSLTVNVPKATGTGVTEGTNDTTAVTPKALADAGIVAGGVPSGTVVFTILTTAPSGWLLFADQTIGDASSGAAFADATAQTIFTALYDNASDSNCPLLTSAGAGTTRGAQGTAATAWAAHCRMTMPKALGRALAVAGSGSGLTPRALAGTAGAETVVLQKSEIPSNLTASYVSDTTPAAGEAITSANSGAPKSLSIDGGGGAHLNMQPSAFLSAMVKL